MSFVKRIASVSVCLLLIICAAVLGAGTGALAGAGMGTNAKITDLKELQNVLDSLSRMGGKDTSTYDSVSGGLKDDEKYSSFTFVETTELYSKSSSSSHSGNSVSGSYQDRSSYDSAFMTRTLEIYATESAIWYKSEGKISSYHSSSNSYSGNSVHTTTSTSTSSYIDFKVQVYIESQTVMLYVERMNFTYAYNYTDSGNHENDKSETEDSQGLNLLKNHFNTWIDCSSYPSIANSFINADNSNHNVFTELASVINDEDSFSVKNNLHTLKNDVLMKMCGIGNDDKDNFSGVFTIDFSAKSMPVIEEKINYNLSYDNSNESFSSRASSDFCLSDRSVFKNINNTVFKNVNFHAIDIADILAEAEE